MNEQPNRRGARRIFIIAVALLLLAYVASPYVFLWRFKEALNARAAGRIET